MKCQSMLKSSQHGIVCLYYHSRRVVLFLDVKQYRVESDSPLCPSVNSCQGSTQTRGCHLYICLGQSAQCDLHHAWGWKTYLNMEHKYIWNRNKTEENDGTKMHLNRLHKHVLLTSSYLCPVGDMNCWHERHGKQSPSFRAVLENSLCSSGNKIAIAAF